MTEKRGGSDVGGATDTIAIQEHGNFYKYVYCSIILFVLPSCLYFQYSFILCRLCKITFTKGALSFCNIALHYNFIKIARIINFLF